MSKKLATRIESARRGGNYGLGLIYVYVVITMFNTKDASTNKLYNFHHDKNLDLKIVNNRLQSKKVK